MNMLRVEALHSMQAVKKLRREIDELNLASRQPSPFATFEYVETFLAHDEYGTREEELLFLGAFDGTRLVGYLPLRKHRDRTLRIPFGRIGVLVSHDTDRPHVVARADDEARCCEAFYRHLLERERGWSLLELAMQDADSGLNTVPSLPRWRYRAYRFETMPNTTVPLKFSSLSEYFKAVPGPQRRNVGRFGRRLLAAGRVEFVACEDPRGGSAMLDLYLDLERRSWKEAAHAGVRRDPRRVELYRALARPEQPMRLGVDLLLLDDLPVSGLIHGAFAGGLYGLEMAFDGDYEDLAPAHTSTLLSVGRGIASHQHSFNFGGNYAYYKARMAGVVTETSAVQIYRVASLPWLKRRAGELKRRFRPPPAAAEAYNPEKRRVVEHDEHDAAEAAHTSRPPRNEERARAIETLRSLEAQGVVLERLSGAELERALPFSTKHDGAPSAAEAHR